MPLSEHEQRILEDIERRLEQDDPRLAEAVSRTSLYAHLKSRIKWAVALFAAGFVMLLLLSVSIWLSVIGFTLMLASAVLAYRYLKQIGMDQLRSIQGKLSLAAILARFSGRFRWGPGPRP